MVAGRSPRPRRRATVIGDGGLATLTDGGRPGRRRGRRSARYLYEPDGAVIRAGLVTAVAAGVDGWLLDEHIAYVRPTTPFRTPFARGYEVLEELPYQEKQLRAALRERGIGRLTIKKRGVDVVPERAARSGWRSAGDAEATLVLTRAAGQGHGAPGPRPGTPGETHDAATVAVVPRRTAAGLRDRRARHHRDPRAERAVRRRRGR